MPLEIIPMVLGAIENNTYLIADTESGLAAVVDPSFDIQPAADEILRRGWTLDAIWLTHAHFDHIAGVSSLLAALDSAAPVALHSADLPLYHGGGGASIFGFSLGPLPEPTVLLKHDQTISLGDHHLRVLHTPGHTPGHVALYSAEVKSVFCGDLDFLSRDWAHRPAWRKLCPPRGKHPFTGVCSSAGNALAQWPRSGNNDRR